LLFTPSSYLAAAFQNICKSGRKEVEAEGRRKEGGKRQAIRKKEEASILIVSVSGAWLHALSAA